MRVSDRSRSIVAFLRCTTDHHYKWGPSVPEDFALNRELEG